MEFKFKNCGSICQVVIFLIVAILGGATLLIGLMINAKIGPQAQQPLTAKISSFSVTGLNLTDTLPISNAQWLAKLLLTNHEGSFEVTIESFEAVLYYGSYNANKNDMVSCGMHEGVQLPAGQEKAVMVEMSGARCDVEDETKRKVRNDFAGKGTASFEVVVDFRHVSFKKGLWVWNYEFMPKCGNLDVMLNKSVAAGYMPDGRPRPCLVPSVK